MKLGRGFLSFIFLLGLDSFLSSCASRHPFLGSLENYTRLEEGLYFKQEYVDPKVDFSKYRNIQVRDVNLEFLDRTAKFKLGFGQAERLASVLKMTLEEELAKKYRLLVAQDRPDKQTLIVEPVLLDVHTPSRGVNAATSFLIFIPVTSGSAAFEAKLKDASTGQAVVEVAEKRTGSLDVKSLAVGAYTRFTHVEGIFKKWSENLLALLEAQ